jgi:REP element-mobilizing transposase RayT
MPQSLASLHCHLIFSTKNREPWLSADLQPRLFEHVGGIVRAEDGRLVAAGGMPDHVHWLVSVGKQIAVAELVRIIKANSSKWIHETQPNLRGFSWQGGYGAFAVSYSQIESVRAYLDHQAEHHRTVTFREGFLRFLERHGLAYDERYLWD